MYRTSAAQAVQASVLTVSTPGMADNLEAGRCFCQRTPGECGGIVSEGHKNPVTCWVLNTLQACKQEGFCELCLVFQAALFPQPG